MIIIIIIIKIIQYILVYTHPQYFVTYYKVAGILWCGKRDALHANSVALLLEPNTTGRISTIYWQLYLILP